LKVMASTDTGQMREDWDRRARENAFHYVASGRTNWTEEEFRASGEQSVRELILDDQARLCPDGDWKAKTMLEIGCGAGRMTRRLADVFGEVHAVDVSGEMLRIARERLADKPNVHLHQIDGRTLEPLGERRFDLVFSTIVFQHIPDLSAIESLVEDAVHHVVAGGILKLHFQGDQSIGVAERDTWLGATVSALDVVRWCADYGLGLVWSSGVGTQEMWVWLRAGAESDALAERELLLASEREWERTREALIARTRWARTLDAVAERLRAHLRQIYGSPAYRLGRRLGLAPEPIDETKDA
jgi:SAM-dependent methyltransferase